MTLQAGNKYTVTGAFSIEGDGCGVKWKCENVSVDFVGFVIE
jgi:hypothetical protein